MQDNVTPVVTVGGWTGSRYFSTLAANTTLRASFATQVKAFVDEYDFGGADIDWEYPGSTGIGKWFHAPHEPARG
jgi:chitinase